MAIKTLAKIIALSDNPVAIKPISLLVDTPTINTTSTKASTSTDTLSNSTKPSIGLVANNPSNPIDSSNFKTINFNDISDIPTNLKSEPATITEIPNIQDTYIDNQNILDKKLEAYGKGIGQYLINNLEELNIKLAEEFSNNQIYLNTISLFDNTDRYKQLLNIDKYQAIKDIFQIGNTLYNGESTPLRTTDSEMALATVCRLLILLISYEYITVVEAERVLSSLSSSSPTAVADLSLTLSSLLAAAYMHLGLFTPTYTYERKTNYINPSVVGKTETSPGVFLLNTKMNIDLYYEPSTGIFTLNGNIQDIPSMYTVSGTALTVLVNIPNDTTLSYRYVSGSITGDSIDIAGLRLRLYRTNGTSITPYINVHKSNYTNMMVQNSPTGVTVGRIDLDIVENNTNNVINNLKFKLQYETGTVATEHVHSGMPALGSNSEEYYASANQPVVYFGIPAKLSYKNIDNFIRESDRFARVLKSVYKVDYTGDLSLLVRELCRVQNAPSLAEFRQLGKMHLALNISYTGDTIHQLSKRTKYIIECLGSNSEVYQGNNSLYVSLTSDIKNYLTSNFEYFRILEDIRSGSISEDYKKYLKAVKIIYSEIDNFLIVYNHFQ